MSPDTVVGVILGLVSIFVNRPVNVLVVFSSFVGAVGVVGGVMLRRAREPYRQWHLLRRLLGSRVRPPVAVLRRYRIRIDDAPEDYLADAQRHPLFELRAT